MNTFGRTCRVFLCLSLLVFGLLGPLGITALNSKYHNRLQEKLGVPSSSGIGKERLQRAGFALASYLEGKGSLPDGLFNETEMAHLEDVKGLVALGKGTLKGTVLVLGLSGLLLLKMGGPRALAKPLLSAGIFGSSLLAVLGVAACGDFSAFWERFHILAFTNDLWLLDPHKDKLIMMFPEEFFRAIVFGTGFLCLFVFATYILSGLLINRVAPHDGAKDS